jgi:hypothetical protein
MILVLEIDGMFFVDVAVCTVLHGEATVRSYTDRRAVPGGGQGGRPPWAPKCMGPPHIYAKKYSNSPRPCIKAQQVCLRSRWLGVLEF